MKLIGIQVVLDIHSLIKRYLLKLRAWQINFLTAPFYTAKVAKPELGIPLTWKSFLDQAVTWRALLEVADSTTRKEIKTYLTYSAKSVNEEKEGSQ